MPLSYLLIAVRSPLEAPKWRVVTFWACTSVWRTWGSNFWVPAAVSLSYSWKLKRLTNSCQALRNSRNYSFQVRVLTRAICIGCGITKGRLTSENWIPLTLLPYSSSGGDHIQMPQMLGTTSKTIPDTPDLAGSPTYKEQLISSCYLNEILETLHGTLHSHWKQIVLSSRTCHRSAWERVCSSQHLQKPLGPQTEGNNLHWPR